MMSTHANLMPTPYTYRELSGLNRKTLKLIAQESGISTTGTKESLCDRILFDKKKEKSGPKPKKQKTDASKLEDEGASKEKIDTILAMKESLKAAYLPPAADPASEKASTFKTSERMTEDEMDKKNVELVNIIAESTGKKFVYRVVGAKNKRKGVTKASSNKKVRTEESVTILSLQKRFASKFTKKAQKEVVKLMGGCPRSNNLAKEFTGALLAEKKKRKKKELSDSEESSSSESESLDSSDEDSDDESSDSESD